MVLQGDIFGCGSGGDLEGTVPGSSGACTCLSCVGLVQSGVLSLDISQNVHPNSRA
jgi:hypothetical protein